MSLTLQIDLLTVHYRGPFNWLGEAVFKLRGDHHEDFRVGLMNPGNLWCAGIFVCPDLQPDGTSIKSTTAVYEKIEPGADEADFRFCPGDDGVSFTLEEKDSLHICACNTAGESRSLIFGDWKEVQR